MEMKNKLTVLISLLILLGSKCLNAQSFSDEKTSAINFVMRVYNSTSFEGVKKIEGDEANYHAVAVSFLNIPKDSLLSYVSKAMLKAQKLAEQGFAEPCVKFEMIDRIEKDKQNTYLFFCETLESFVLTTLKKKQFDGARIVSAPNNKFLISLVTLDNSKYTSPEMQDKAAHMKAKQFANSLMNGSTITSDVILRTDENDNSTEVTSTEIIKEHSMGFINGLELLVATKIQENKTTYIYFSKI